MNEQSVVPEFSLPRCYVSKSKEPIDILIEQERDEFLSDCIEEVAPERRQGFESVYGFGEYPNVAEATKCLGKCRATLYRHHAIEIKNIREKFSKADLE